MSSVANFSMMAFACSSERHDDCEHAVNKEGPDPENGRNFWADNLHHEKSDHAEDHKEVLMTTLKIVSTMPNTKEMRNP